MDLSEYVHNEHAEKIGVSTNRERSFFFFTEHSTGSR